MPFPNNIPGVKVDKPIALEFPQRPAEINVDNAKQYVIDKMRKLDQDKYPPSCFTYERYEAKEPEGAVITYIKHNQANDPSLKYHQNQAGVWVDREEKEVKQEDLDNNKAEIKNNLARKEMHALAVRKLTVIGGILTGLETGFLGVAGDENRQYLTEKLLQLAEEIQPQDSDAPPADPTERMQVFYGHLVDAIVNANVTDMPAHSIMSKLCSEKKNPEVYFSGEYKQTNEILVEETVGFGVGYDNNNKTCKIQVDIQPKETITPELFNEYRRIFDENNNNRPIWFNRLPEWERELLKKQLQPLARVDPCNNPPLTVNQKRAWNNSTFSKRSKSCTNAKIPSISNLRESLVYQYDPDHPERIELISHSYKSGIPLCFEMPDVGTTRRDNAKFSMTQVLGCLQKGSQQIADSKEESWGDAFRDGLTQEQKDQIKPIIYVGALLSDVWLFTNPDRSYVRQERAAFETAVAELKDDKHEYIFNNEPMNFIRSITENVAHETRIYINNRWKETDRLLVYAHNFTQALKDDAGLSPQQQRKKRLIDCAVEELKNMRNLSITDGYPFCYFGRNYPAFKSAYDAILVEAMGGAVLTHCKSGKDRTGEEEIYRLAMLEYFRLRNRLPSYIDGDAERQEFVRIYTTIYRNMKIEEVANGNTPGAFGIKDTPGVGSILCSDIRDSLNQSGEFKLSCKLAKLNKVDSPTGSGVEYRWKDRVVYKVQKSEKGFYVDGQSGERYLKHIGQLTSMPGNQNRTTYAHAMKAESVTHIAECRTGDRFHSKPVVLATRETILRESNAAAGGANNVVTKISYDFYASSSLSNNLPDKDIILRAIERIVALVEKCRLNGMTDPVIVIKNKTDPALAVAIYECANLLLGPEKCKYQTPGNYPATFAEASRNSKSPGNKDASKSNNTTIDANLLNELRKTHPWIPPAVTPSPEAGIEAAPAASVKVK